MARSRKISDSLFTGSLFPEMSVHPSIERAARSELSARARAFRERAAAETSQTDDFSPLQSSDLSDDNHLRFFSIGSGSSGNCAYLGNSENGLLIDAGVDTFKVENSLRSNGISIDSVKGIIVTHDHGDHIRYLYALARRHKHLGVYCTPRTFGGIMRRHSISRRLKDYHRPIYKEFPFKVGNLEVTAFDVSHDGTDNCGYFISDSAGHTFAIATDLGCITPRVDHYLRLARHIVIESNYDAGLLSVGPYPEYLKARIKAPNGHLDNVVTARFVSEVAALGNLSHVFLCHLSHDNNRPDIARDTIVRALCDAGLGPVGDASMSADSRDCRLQVAVLPRFDASPLYHLY